MENSSQCLINIDKTNYSQSLSIQIDDPNNNEHCDFKTNLQSDNNLLLVNDLSKTSVIVEHSSFSNSTLTRRPILTDRENFFADNPTVLLNGNQSQFKPNEPLPTHPRIAFRRISAPPKLLSERQINNTNMVSLNYVLSLYNLCTFRQITLVLWNYLLQLRLLIPTYHLIR